MVFKYDERVYVLHVHLVVFAFVSVPLSHSPMVTWVISAKQFVGGMVSCCCGVCVCGGYLVSDFVWLCNTIINHRLQCSLFKKLVMVDGIHYGNGYVYR